jgi:hypothetical protein
MPFNMLFRGWIRAVSLWIRYTLLHLFTFSSIVDGRAVLVLSYYTMAF